MRTERTTVPSTCWVGTPHNLQLQSLEPFSYPFSFQGAPWQQAAAPAFFLHSLREMQQPVHLGSALPWSHPGFAVPVKRPYEARTDSTSFLCGGKNWGPEKLNVLTSHRQVVEMEFELRLG